jgi:MoaA/NifB/PqqE/SkfB family radical SAM enzyme
MIENKAYMPELVDLKITDYCTYNCAYCYQNSTTEGRHAEIDLIEDIILDCVSNEVFEIAIGGGEPTTHPDFLRILKFGRENGIQLNFTTRNSKFLMQNAWLLEHHSVAFSIDSVTAIEWYNAIKHLPQLQFTPQLVSGVLTEEQYTRIMEFCKEKEIIPTLLGFKQVGRGGPFKLVHSQAKMTPEAEIEIALRTFGKINVDTAMLKQCSNITGSICKKLFFTNEGLVSCYIDAVNKTIASSSYHEETAIPYHSLSADWKKLPVV